ncbi:MAG: hypothetical protein CK425_05160 [Parachlamydia sp.]|nr:MAG: hypothetical protein CK425_05160 [Parachlamydia sp.]
MPDLDPIHHLAQVVYSTKQAAEQIKSKAAEWGHSISTKLDLHSPQVLKKMQAVAKKKLSPTVPAETPSTPKASSAAPGKQKKESGKLAKKASQYFQEVKAKFDSSYQTIKAKDEVSKEAKALLNGPKKFNELNAKEQGIIKLYFSACTPKEAEKVFKSLVKSNNPSTLAVFQSVISTDREKILNHLLESTGFSRQFVEHVKNQITEAGSKEVLAFLNSSPSGLSQLTTNALLTSENKMTIPGTDQQISIKEFTKDALLTICQGGPEAISQNRNFLLNVPSHHLKEILTEVWETNPVNVLAAIATLQPLAQTGDATGTEAGIKDFLGETLKSPEGRTEFLQAISAFHPDDFQGMANMLSAIPPALADGIFKEIVAEKSYGDQFLLQIANHFISTEVQNINHPGEILRQNNTPVKFIVSLQKELSAPLFASESTEIVLWAQIPNHQLKKTDVETKETSMTQTSKNDYRNGMEGILEHINGVTQNIPATSPLKQMYQHLNNEMNARFPSEGNLHGKNAVMGLFILRAVNPLLLNPSEAPLLGHQPQNAIELAKGLQKFANDQKFTDNDAYLSFLNPYLETKADFRNQLFDQLTQT